MPALSKHDTLAAATLGAAAALARCSPELVQRLAHIRLLSLDVDGVLTDGQLYLSGDNESKAFDVRDGLGIIAVRRAGIEVAIISARPSAATTARARDLGISHLRQGDDDKGAVLLGLCQQLDIDPSHVVHMGDDVADLPALRCAGVAATVADAHPAVLDMAEWHSNKKGGHGAVRELCDLLLVTRSAGDGP